MLLRILIALSFLIQCISCSDGSKSKRPDDAIGVGTEFIEASLKGRYSDAKKFLLPDSLNLMYFERMENFYNKMPDDEKEGYKNANIIINSTEAVTDTISIINYSNTFKKEASKIKLVKIASEWWVDFKYTFSGNL